MTTERPDPRLGTDFGPYRIESVIGRGGMGVVYLAEERRLKRRVALKVLPPELADDADFRARFERESQMAAAIDDPNILPIYEADEIDGVLFIAMRYVEGTDLEARLRAGPMDPAEAVRLLGQVGSALDAAHLRGLVHRDVKPANILIASGAGDERGEHAYLSDFGLTKARTQDTSLTRAGAIMGTLDTMAPEQLEGHEVTGAADQYALATVAHRALTGSPPFERDSEAALITAILRDPPPAVTARRPDLPVAIDAVLARAMAKRPEDRYPTCAAFIGELRGALGIVATRGAETQTAINGRRRMAALVGGVAIVLLAAGAIALALGAGGQGAGPSTSPSLGAAVSARPDPSAYPNTDEGAVLALLPSDVAIRCRRGSYDNVVAEGGASSRPLASLACTLSGRGFEGTTPDRVTALRLRSSTLVTPDRVVDGVAKAHDLPVGDCSAEQLPAAGAWAPDGTEVGRVACWIEGSDAVVEWSQSREGLVFRVARGNRDEGGAIQLWQEIGGAVLAATGSPPTTGPSGAGDPGTAAPSTDPAAFPNPEEMAALALVPESIRASCVRGSGVNDAVRAGFDGQVRLLLGASGTPDVVGVRVPVPAAALTCDPPTGASRVHFLWYKFRTSGNRNAVDFLSLLGVRYKIEDGRCGKGEASRDSWTNERRGSGLLICLRTAPFDGSPWLDWTFAGDQMLALATRDDRDFDTLHKWFEGLRTFLP